MIANVDAESASEAASAPVLNYMPVDGIEIADRQTEIVAPGRSVTVEVKPKTYVVIIGMTSNDRWYLNNTEIIPDSGIAHNNLYFDIPDTESSFTVKRIFSSGSFSIELSDLTGGMSNFTVSDFRFTP